MDTRTTRRALLLSAAVGAVAGCTTAAVPYGANEAGQMPGDVPSPAGTPAAAMMATQGTGEMSNGKTSTGKTSTGGTRAGGVVLGDAQDIPVGGGVIFTTEKVVVTQPVKGQYRAFSAVCTHVGCILNKISNGTIDCPCHGSEFTITNGAVVTGPAMAPLPKRKIKIKDGKVIML